MNLGLGLFITQEVVTGPSWNHPRDLLGRKRDDLYRALPADAASAETGEAAEAGLILYLPDGAGMSAAAKCR